MKFFAFILLTLFFVIASHDNFLNDVEDNLQIPTEPNLIETGEILETRSKTYSHMLNALNPTEGVVLERRQRFTFKQQNQDTKKEKEENLNIDPIAMAIKSEGFLSY